MECQLCSCGFVPAEYLLKDLECHLVESGFIQLSLLEKCWHECTDGFDASTTRDPLDVGLQALKTFKLGAESMIRDYCRQQGTENFKRSCLFIFNFLKIFIFILFIFNRHRLIPCGLIDEQLLDLNISFFPDLPRFVLAFVRQRFTFYLFLKKIVGVLLLLATVLVFPL